MARHGFGIADVMVRSMICSHVMQSEGVGALAKAGSVWLSQLLIID